MLRLAHRHVHIVRRRRVSDRGSFPSLSYLITRAIVVTLRSRSVAGIVEFDLVCAPALNRILGGHPQGA